MPRGRLNEKHVQQEAVKWLASHYADKVDVRAVHARMEAVVRRDSKLGHGRADGLVASLMSDGTVYTAALEAKSARTLFSISLRYSDTRWIMHALFAGLLTLLLTGVIGWFFSDTWLLRWGLPVVAFFATAFVYLLVTYDHTRYRLIDVIRQVKRYPANERWIAVSADAYNELDDDLQEALRSDCRMEGIGLLRVRSASQIIPLEEPQTRGAPAGLADFLECYARSSGIRQELRTISAEG
jgi:hypothetical protein